MCSSVTIILIQHVKKRELSKPITWIMYYFHRYWRLTPPMIFFIFFVIAYAQYIDGPVQAAGGIFKIMLSHNLAQTSKNFFFISIAISLEQIL